VRPQREVKGEGKGKGIEDRAGREGR